MLGKVKKGMEQDFPSINEMKKAGLGDQYDEIIMQIENIEARMEELNASESADRDDQQMDTF